MSPGVSETQNEGEKQVECAGSAGTPLNTPKRGWSAWLRNLKLSERVAGFYENTRNLIRSRAVEISLRSKKSGTKLRAWAQLEMLRLYDQIIVLPLRARFHFYRRRTRYAQVGAAIVVVLILFACWEGFFLWALATAYCARLSPSTFEQVEVYLGSSISGLLAIVFALTTFAIQQVAAREAAEVVLEYASDRRMASTYWILAAFATICFALPFVHLPQIFWPMEIVLFTLLLILTFLLIYRHFKIVMLYSDPRFTVDRLRQRGLKELSNVARTVKTVRRTMRKSEGERS